MSRTATKEVWALGERIAKARREKRSQQALELANMLLKQEPTDEHRELQRQVALERGEQLLAEGKRIDAANVFKSALQKGGPPEFLTAVIEKLAACGEIGLALANLHAVAELSARQRVLQHIADAAILSGAAGKAALPAELQAGFDAILAAFRHYEAGRDDEARTLLQSIGLQSPFLEWKILLRGLMAYVARDNARALENWQRLDPARL